MRKTRKRILKQIAEGRISAKEGEKLLQELEREKGREYSSWNFGSSVISPANIRNMIPKLTPAVNDDFLEALQSGAYDGVTWVEFKELVLQNVDPSYVKELAKLGYDDLSEDHLYEFIIFGASPKYIEALKKRGYKDIPERKLIEMCIHRVSLEFIVFLSVNV